MSSHNNLSQYSLRAIIALFSLLLMLPFSGNSQESGEYDLLFITRVDDILSRNTTFMPSSIIPFQEMAESRGVPVTWAVMPHRFREINVNRGQMTQDLLVSVANGHEISLHGFIHICQQCQNVQGAAFWGHEMYCTTLQQPLNYAQQEKLILDGLKILSDSIGIRPTSFIPPGHVSDATTHSVLVDQDIRAIAIDQPAGFTTTNLYNVGTSEDFGWELTPANYASRRTQALADIRENGINNGHYTLLLHDPFTRAGYRNGILIDWTAEVIDSVKAEYGDRVKFVTLTEAADLLSGSETSIDSPSADIPRIATLLPNYPNPFNPTTTIPFELNTNAHVTLRVYDVHGRLVADLVNKLMLAGKHDVVFNGAQLSSGVYLYELFAGEKRLVRAMILVK
jgi:hypothetical protein